MKYVKLIVFFCFISVQAMATQTDWSAGDSGSTVRAAIQANDTEIYNILDGTTPTLGPLSIGGTGDSWLEMTNNTTLVDDYTGIYGVRFYNGVLQQIINGTASSIGSGGSSVTYQTSDPDDTDATGFYLNTTDGDFFHVSQNVGVSTWSTVFTPSAVIPEYSSGSILAVGNIIEMTFDNNLAEGANWSNTGLFTVDASVTGADIAVTTTDITGAVITGTLASVIEQDEITTVSFAGGANVLEGTDGSDVIAFTDGAVTNNSAQTPGASYEVTTGYLYTYVDASYPDTNIKLAIYDSNTNALIGVSNSNTHGGATGWRPFTFEAGIILTPGTTYDLAFVKDGYAEVAQDVGSWQVDRINAIGTYATPPASNSTGVNQSGGNFGIYFTNSNDDVLVGLDSTVTLTGNVSRTLDEMVWSSTGYVCNTL